MPQLPEAVKDAWEKRSGPAIFATVSDESVPNAIYVTCVAVYDEGTVVIAEDYAAQKAVWPPRRLVQEVVAFRGHVNGRVIPLAR